jgi:hypothetical protein
MPIPIELLKISNVDFGMPVKDDLRTSHSILNSLQVGEEMGVQWDSSVCNLVKMEIFSNNLTH